MQQHSEYSLPTNSERFMQQVFWPLSQVDNNICNCYLLQSIYVYVYLQIGQKLHQVLKTFICCTSTSSQTFDIFMHDSLLQATQHLR